MFAKGVQGGFGKCVVLENTSQKKVDVGGCHVPPHVSGQSLTSTGKLVDESLQREARAKSLVPKVFLRRPPENSFFVV